jgi:hypothetical protein
MNQRAKLNDGPEPLTEFLALFQKLSPLAPEQARRSWEVMNAAAAKFATAMQDSSSIATKEYLAYASKLMELASTNANAALELVNAVANAKEPSEIMAISSAHARRQLEQIVQQNRELWTAAQRIANISSDLFSGQASDQRSS